MTRMSYGILGILVLSLFAISFAYAADLRTGDQISVGAQERIADDLYIAGGNVTSSGTVLGDLFAAGGSVLVNGEVRSDLFASGGTVTILGKVLDDLRVAGGNLIITSDVASDVVALGGNIHISGKVGGDALIAGGAIRVDAPIAGDVHIAGGDIYINAPINGKVQIEADKLTLGSSAIIAGDLVYRAASEVTLENGAQVKGKTEYTPKMNVREGLKQGFVAFLSLWLVLKFLMLLAGAMLFGLFFKRYGTELTRRALAEPIPGFLTGLVTMITLPILSGILMATVIGMPLGILGLLSFFILLVFSGLITPVILGSLLAVWLFKKSGEVSWKTILLGVVVFYIAGFIPFVGQLARLFFVLLAIGTALRFKWEFAKEWR